MAIDTGTVEKYIAARRKVSREELSGLLQLAEKHGGELVDVTTHGAADGDDWCGTMWFRKPRPKVGDLVDSLVGKGWTVEIFPRGIKDPMLEVVIRNQAANRF